MTNEERKKIVKEIYDAIFEGKGSVEINGRHYDVSLTTGGLRYITVGDVRFIEQNPRTGSWWATKAIQGSKILWGIRENGQYAYRVVDGKVKILDR